jgi:carbon-monoxide dehydrogenase small subunit
LTRIKLRLNGVVHEVEVEPRCTLVNVIRDKLGLTGTKQGCNGGVCGACTVIMDGRAVLSCLMFAVQADGKDITTIEGLEQDGELHPLQKSFIDHFGFECGFCTSGMIMTAKELLDRNPHPSKEDVKEQMAGNICRCGAYVEIIESVLGVGDMAKKEQRSG